MKNDNETAKELLDDCDTKRYIDAYNGSRYEPPYITGHTDIKVLEFLNGLPFNNLTLAYIHGLHPSTIRVSHGCVCCDAMSNRVTIYLTEDDKIDYISQEIVVGYATGHVLYNVYKALKENRSVPDFPVESPIYFDPKILECEF